MADEIDRAQAREQQLREAALKHHRKLEAPSQGGECLWCGDKLPITRRWCNADCRDAWQQHVLRKRRDGNGIDL